MWALTFSHVSVASDGAAFAGWLAGSSGRKADKANALLQVGLTVQLQNRNVIVQRLRVVIVMDVGRGHPQSLSAWTSELLRQIVVANADVDSIAGSNNARESNKEIDSVDDES